jgi:uncharacterized membrane-anchored protein YhcB (DUF1043 family)
MTEPTQAGRLFRENALKRCHSPDDLQASLKVTRPGDWLWLMIMISILAGLMIWVVWGRLTMTVSSTGIILPLSYIQHSEKVIQENLRDHQARVKMLKNILDSKRHLYQKHYLTVTELEKAEAEYIYAKSDLMNSQQHSNPNIDEAIFNEDKFTPNQPLYALVFVKNGEGKRIANGMTAYVLPKILSAYEYGYIKGKVESISRYPASREVAYSYLGNMSLVDEYFYGGAPFIVKIRLTNNPDSVSGLSWTTSKGAAFTIQSGTTVTAMIVSQVSTPLKFLTHIEY